MQTTTFLYKLGKDGKLTADKCKWQLESNLCMFCGGTSVSQSVDLGWSNNPNTTPTKDYKNLRVVVYLRSVQRGYAEEGERGSTPTG